MKTKILLLVRYLMLHILFIFSKIFNKKKCKLYLIKIFFVKKKIFSNLIKKNEFINYLKKIYPQDFQINYLYAINFFENCNKKFPILLDKSWKLRQKWVYKKKIKKYDMGNVAKSTIVGSLGNHFYLANWLLTTEYKLNSYKKTEIIINKKDKFSNSELFNYFKPKIKLTYDHTIGKKEKEIKEQLTIPLDYAIPLQDNLVQIHIATNIINNKKRIKNINKPIFTLSKKHKNIGYSYLKKMGLNKNDWFVTLHVREGSSKKDYYKERFRNSDINSYLKAIKFITDRGGYVFRMGDKNMSSIPKLKNVFNYAASAEKSEILDIFLGAKSKFCIATSSGYYVIPYMFGVPILMTNSISILDYWLLRENDYFLPRKIFCKRTNKNLKLKQSLNLPYSLITGDLDYYLKKLEIKIIPNSSEEIDDAVREMCNSLLNRNKIKNDKLNFLFKKTMNKTMKNYSNLKLNALTKIPKNFLKHNI